MLFTVITFLNDGPPKNKVSFAIDNKNMQPFISHFKAREYFVIKYRGENRSG